MTDRIEADYLIETAEDPARAAEVMAGEQSSGTFVSVPGEDNAGVRVARAVVERLEIVGEAERPAFRDQALWLSQAWDAELVIDPGRHHFDVIESLGQPDGALTLALLA